MDAPFTDVICPQYVKTVRVGEDARIEVTVQRLLVFLNLPGPDDLRDVVPITPDGENVIHDSPDAREILRTPTRHGTFVYWTPREPIVPYALYTHQHGWSSAGLPVEAALYTEFRCETRTGTVGLEIITPGRFEAAVAFKRPRWRRMASEQSLVKYALTQLESEGERPVILDDGTRLEWKLAGPRIGERYVCVAFQQDGVTLWQKRLEASSLAARMRRLLRPLTSA